MLRRLAVILAILLSAALGNAVAQDVSGKWSLDGLEDGEFSLTLNSGGTGSAQMSLAKRHLAIGAAEGRRIWGTLRTTGGYYFIVYGKKTAPIRWHIKDSVLSIEVLRDPIVTVSAELDVEYSSRELSDYGDYKKQIIAQWRRDFPTNEDVKKYKWIMEQYLAEQYKDVFDVFVDGDYKIVDISTDSLVIFNNELDVNLLWRK